ncbi:hypothetical protein ACF8Q9_22090 [Pseudomonas sp. TYF_15]|uniref:hypothetical protein n=1 Tax=Pseudomonas TaxID=286 RepID=UPI0023DF552D|nr:MULTISPECIES: hypothetical protein [Pseudomonas]MDF3173540.1 hypothetical protein [Pseudomonas sp. ER28]HDS0956543.1 hypothetical protein [Pseudomonas putida]
MGFLQAKNARVLAGFELDLQLLLLGDRHPRHQQSNQRVEIQRELIENVAFFI